MNSMRKDLNYLHRISVEKRKKVQIYFNISWNNFKGILQETLSRSIFSAANLALAVFPITNALGENLPPRH